MKNKLTRKLMLSAFTLLFAVISLGASTYAWFTLSKDANVDAFQGKVTSGTSGLEIGVGLIGDTEPFQWRATTLDLAGDLNELSADILSNLKFDAIQNGAPLASGSFYGLKHANVAGKYAGDLQHYAGEVLDLGEGVKQTQDGTYLAFQLFFRLADTNDLTADASVYLTSYEMLTNPINDGQKLINGDVDEWHVNKDYKDINNLDVTVESGTKPKYYVSDAARMAIIGKETEQKYLIETNKYASSVSGFYSSGSQANGALSYYNAVNGTTIACPDGYTNPDVGPLDSQKKAGELEVCDLVKADKYTGSITVQIWIDGWDGECINAIFGQTLCINLAFSLEKK